MSGCSLVPTDISPSGTGESFMRKISGMLNLEKARMQLRVLLSGPVPAITPMAHAVAIKVVLDALDASERRVAELEQVCTAAGIRIKGEQVK
jgi:hypothetical protein